MGIGEAVAAGIGLGSVLLGAGAALHRLGALEKVVDELRQSQAGQGKRIGDLEGDVKADRRVAEVSRSYSIGRVDTEGKVR